MIEVEGFFVDSIVEDYMNKISSNFHDYKKVNLILYLDKAKHLPISKSKKCLKQKRIYFRFMADKKLPLIFDSYFFYN